MDLGPEDEIDEAVEKAVEAKPPVKNL